MIKRITTITVIVVLGLAAALLIGACRHDGPYKGAAFMADYLTEALDLSEEQQAMLNTYRDEILAKGRALHGDRKKIHDELKAQLSGDAIDTIRVKALIAEQRAKMDGMLDLVVERVAEFHRSLTPEQREKLVAKLEQFESWHSRSWHD